MRGLPLALVLAAVAVVPGSAAAAQGGRVEVERAVDAHCAERVHGGAGTAALVLRAPRGGYLSARLRARGGDWDLAVFREARGPHEPTRGAGPARGPRLVAASAYSGARELASGFVRRGERLVVRACRRSGAARTARVRFSVERVPAERRERVALVRVRAPRAAVERRLVRLGLDVAGRSAAHALVLLHGRDDARRLRAGGFSYARVQPEARRAVRARAAALPSGRPATSYRRLADYGNEMKALAAANPDLVRPITLPLTSRLGRPVEGLEITTNPNAADGKPVYLQLGLHHAREWPSGEQPLEWAHELINAYRAGDPRTRSLVGRVRTIVVPVVNPDGFNFSREAGETAGHGGGDDGFSAASAEYHRKNCTPSGCALNAGIDVNRNYGDRWGGDGASASPSSDTYRGPAPFSEPEAENIRRLISSRQVVMLITNHTFGNEILRQPGESSDGATPDEARMDALGGAMAAQNGYANIFSWQIGDHVGTADGWSYYTTGGFGYVFEMGPERFHPPYADVVAHYDGSAAPGGGNREAYYVAMESAANAADHAVLSGSAPAGALLRLTKSFTNRATAGAPTSERFETTMEVPSSGRFEWHVNQSSRPLVPGETWTLTCERPPGAAHLTQQVAVARGQRLELDLSGCGRGPAGPGSGDGLLSAGVRARFNGRVYSVRVSGRVEEVGGAPAGENCTGIVSVAVRARTRKVASGRTAVTETCRFARVLRFRPRSLPRPLRGRGARIRLRVAVGFGGNDVAAPERLALRTRVRRR